MRVVFVRVAVALFAGVALMAGTAGKGDLQRPLSNPFEIYKAAKRAASEGRDAAALRSLEAAAKQDILAAQIDLARIYATGKGGPLNHARAFHFYERIARQFADIDPSLPAASVVAEAFLKAALYYKEGIAEIDLKPRPSEAARMLFHGASYFYDPAAQYELALLYLAGVGTERNPKMAVNWLHNAANRRFPPAQALLGDMLWKGKDVRHAPAEGLGMLAIAKGNAAPEDKRWIDALYENALAEADLKTVEATDRFLQKWGPVYSSNQTAVLRILPLASNSEAGRDAEKIVGGEAKTAGQKDGEAASAAQEDARRPGLPAPSSGFGLNGPVPGQR